MYRASRELIPKRDIYPTLPQSSHNLVEEGRKAIKTTAGADCCGTITSVYDMVHAFMSSAMATCTNLQEIKPVNIPAWGEERGPS